MTITEDQSEPIILQYGFTADGGFVIKASTGWASYAYPHSGNADQFKHALPGDLPAIVRHHARLEMPRDLAMAAKSQLVREGFQHKQDTPIVGMKWMTSL